MPSASVSSSTPSSESLHSAVSGSLLPDLHSLALFAREPMLDTPMLRMILHKTNRRDVVVSQPRLTQRPVPKQWTGNAD